MELNLNELAPHGPCGEMLAQFFDRLPMGVSVQDVNNTIIYYNRALSLIDDMEPTEVVGRHISEAFRSFDSKGLLSQRCLDTRQHFVNHPLFYYNRLGKLVNAILHVFPLTRESRLLGCICFVGEYKDLAILPGMAIERKPIAVEKSKTGRDGLYTFGQIITKNQDMQRAIEVMARSAASDSSIMLYGETGSGKEMFAQAAHHFSQRAQKPFMAVSCAAIPENLLEGLLFGTVKGAFTGAQDRPGLMEVADGGTLFLDEINSMPLGLQSKMLRAIQERSVKRIGENKERTVSLKIISATNSHPHRAVTEGQLRPDLLYRLGVVIVEIPPLRHRKDDLGVLAEHFINKLNKRLGKNVTGLTPSVLEAFEKHYWPGNVRELEHAIESAMNLIPASDSTLEPFHFSSSLVSRDIMGGQHSPAIVVHEAPQWMSTLQQNTLPVDNQPESQPSILNQQSSHSLGQGEPAEIIKALEDSGGNVARAARALNISPQLMHNRIKKYGLKKQVTIKM